MFPGEVFVQKGNVVLGKKKGDLWSLLTEGLYSGGGGGGGGG